MTPHCRTIPPALARWCGALTVLSAVIPRKSGLLLEAGTPSLATGGPTLLRLAPSSLESQSSHGASALSGNTATRCPNPADSSPVASQSHPTPQIVPSHTYSPVSFLSAGASRLSNTRRPRRSRHRREKSWCGDDNRQLLISYRGLYNRNKQAMDNELI